MNAVLSNMKLITLLLWSVYKAVCYFHTNSNHWLNLSETIRTSDIVLLNVLVPGLLFVSRLKEAPAIVPQLSKCLKFEAVRGDKTDQMIWIWTKIYNKTRACIAVHRMARHNHLID